MEPDNKISKDVKSDGGPRDIICGILLVVYYIPIFITGFFVIIFVIFWCFISILEISLYF